MHPVWHLGEVDINVDDVGHNDQGDHGDPDDDDDQDDHDDDDDQDDHYDVGHDWSQISVELATLFVEGGQ